MNKEELQNRIGKLELQLDRMIDEDKRIRKEFAKAFSWGEDIVSYYGNEKKYIIPTWEQIFVKVGKLLANQKYLDYITDIENLKLRIKELEVKQEYYEQKTKENKS